MLIGMPGAGKSTVGVVLAKRLGYRFVDSDLVIQEKHDKLLHELIEEHGVEGFWKIEEEVNASLKPPQERHRHRRKRHLRSVCHGAPAGNRHSGLSEASS